MSRGINIIEELDTVEKEEADYLAEAQALGRLSSNKGYVLSDFMANWEAVYPEVKLDFLLFGIFSFISPRAEALSQRQLAGYPLSSYGFPLLFLWYLSSIYYIFMIFSYSSYMFFDLGYPSYLIKYLKSCLNRLFFHRKSLTTLTKYFIPYYLRISFMTF